MTNHDKFFQFCNENRNLGWSEFFQKLVTEFKVSCGCATDMWYATERSWYRPEMMDELIRLDNPKESGFRPNLRSGEFEWDAKNNRFLPDQELLAQAIKDEKNDLLG